MSATGGEYLIANLATEVIELLPFDASAAEVAQALEAVYPNRSATVIEEASGEADTRVFTITFPGQKVSPPFVADAGIFGGVPLSGGEASATIEETQAGEDTTDEVILSAANLGEATADGTTSPIVIEDQLPAGVEVASVSAEAGGHAALSNRGPVVCQAKSAQNLAVCVFGGTYLNDNSESTRKTLPPYDQIEVRIKVKPKPGAQTGEINHFTVSGGTAAPASSTRPLDYSPEPVPFGVEDYELDPEEEGGGPVTQAGSHPFQFTTSITFNQLAATTANQFGYEAIPAALTKDVNFHWPPGLLGNPSPFPRCTLGQFLKTTDQGLETINTCPPQTAVGVATVTFEERFDTGLTTLPVPIFNLEPVAGEPARVGFYVGAAGVPVLIDPSIRSGNGEDYGINISTTNVSQLAAILSTQATVWGVPGDPRHDNSRGWACLAEARGTQHFPCNSSEEPHPSAFLTLPTACSGAPLGTSVETDSWLQPGILASALASPPMPVLDGCNRLPFAPTIHSEPTSNAATSPTGLNFDLNFADEGLVNANGLAQSQMKKAVVTLPVGFTTNPSVAEGLKACPQAAYGAATVQEGTGCPQESKIGDVEIESPLVTGKKVLGGLYVAQQHQNPYNNLLTIYLVARNPELGILVKQALKVTPNPVTGQLVTEVDNVPQLPFSRFHLSFRQGQRSPLVTPPACGTYTVSADLYPYSNPSAPVHQESSFKITQGAEGLGCPSGGVPPFHPALEAGTINNAAGTYSPFYTHITRKDSEQEITRFSIKLPPGVVGKLAGVSSCSDAAIAAAKSREVEGGGGLEEANPSCPKNSEVGHTLVGAGVGNVLAYAPGKLYLAGPYHGSQLSLVSVTAAKVGPFDLGTVVVRFALKIDPESAEVSVDGATSDPIPHIVDGIPVHLRDIRAYVDKPQFVLNPTSCKKTSTAATVLGSGLNFASEADDQPVTVSSPFQAADCASLGFKPKLALSLKGGTKRGDTPRFKAVLTYPKGSYANIREAQVTLPHSEFLEQAHIGTVCTRVQFKEGTVPGEKCPAASVYGRARAVSPLLDEPLEGPVYLRSSSHNLPDLVAALHNKQVDIALDGRIDSIKNGRIRNTFESVPDAPVSKFVLEMQGGKKGLLVNSTNLCAHTNRAISHFVGQNGKLSDTNPVLHAQCGKKSRKGHKHKGAHK
ncbi:MAG: hypothetical protein H0X42_04995 [Solirubrobacterales bacterium]|nr:hypothetical protein [Solirubrobacterales bacterium]